MDDHNTGPVVFCIILCVLFFVFALRGNYRDEYESLESEYHDLLLENDNLHENNNDLLMKYSDLSHDYDSCLDRIYSIEDDITNLWCYFEHEEDVSFDDAYESFTRINAALFPD